MPENLRGRQYLRLEAILAAPVQLAGALVTPVVLFQGPEGLVAPTPRLISYVLSVCSRLSFGPASFAMPVSRYPHFRVSDRRMSSSSQHRRRSTPLPVQSGELLWNSIHRLQWSVQPALDC